MKYFVIVLALAGIFGTAFGQSIEDISDKFWLPNCPIGTSTECDQSSLFPDAIALPFFQSDSVAIGTIVEKDSQTQDSILYSLDVEFYLKNYQPFDLIAATLNETPEPQRLPEVFWYNSPVFNEGDLVFVYLEKLEGGYRLLPESFALDKHEVRGPAPTIHWNTSPSENVFKQGEKIPVSGEVRKLELVEAVKEGKELEAKLMVMDSNDRDNIIFSDSMKIESDGNYNYFLDTSKIPPGKFELEVNYGPSTYGNEITIKPNFKIWTPIKQHNFGISNEEIQCRENLVLVQKYDGSPACVKPETKVKLMQRGWAQPLGDVVFERSAQPEPEPDPIPEETPNTTASDSPRYISPFDEKLIHEYQKYHTVITGKVVEWYGQKQPSKYYYQYRVEPLAFHTPRMQDDPIYIIMGNEDNFIPVDADAVLFGLDVDDQNNLYIKEFAVYKAQP